MKFTDQFFEFPIRVYDADSLKRALIKEDATNVSSDGEWVQGSVKFPVWDLNDMFWYDAFSRGRSIDEVVEEGFDATVITHYKHGDFECMWSRKLFEKKLNEFVERIWSQEDEVTRAGEGNFDPEEE